MRSAPYKARKSEAQSKAKLQRWCKDHKWQVVFFEGTRGGPRTGIVDAVMIRLRPRQPDTVEVRLVQLKSGGAGLTPREIARMKKAVQSTMTDWAYGSWDGETFGLHQLHSSTDS
jgi:hypothetical protein